MSSITYQEEIYLSKKEIIDYLDEKNISYYYNNCKELIIDILQISIVFNFEANEMYIIC